MINLKTKCIDNKGYKYDVFLTQDFKYSNGKLILCFNGAPSGWYVKTLMNNNNSNILAIDFGQHWYCVNIKEILAEIKELL